MSESIDVLVTCPPMIGISDIVAPHVEERGWRVFYPQVKQALSEGELLDLVADYDGWIVGDDPVTDTVIEKGKQGRLLAAVKWGVGVDNIDFDACRKHNLPITNTPNMFGDEVSDLALSYVIALARDTFYVDRMIRKGEWPKPRGMSLAGKTLGLIGYGDIGSKLCSKLLALGLRVIVYDPYVEVDKFDGVDHECWPNRVDECDVLVLTCKLTEDTYHILEAGIFERCKSGTRIVNVSRGQLIEERALLDNLKSGKIYSVALDVFTEEPLEETSPFLDYPRCVLGSHNASNTNEAVLRTSLLAIEKLNAFLSEA